MFGSRLVQVKTESVSANMNCHRLFALWENEAIAPGNRIGFFVNWGQQSSDANVDLPFNSEENVLYYKALKEGVKHT